MEMTIDNIIQSLIAMKSVIGVNQLTINEATDTMRKYQKIEQIISNFDESSNYFQTLEQIAKVVQDEK